MALKNTSSSSGNWTREADLADAVAVLIEPKRYERDVPNEKFGTTRNILDANLTIFDKAAIDGGKPDVIKNALLTGAGTTRQYDEESIGEAFVAKFVLTPSKRGKDFYPPRGVDDAIFDKVSAYMEQRDAKVKEAMSADLPDWAND